MLGKISYYKDPLLRLICEPVTEKDDLTYMLNRMKYLMKKHEGVGLSANQAGFNKRVFIYDVGDGLKTILNPEIPNVSKFAVREVEEGCLSLPMFYWMVPRAENMYGSYQDLEFNSHKNYFEGLEAQVWQHEVNHLNGNLIVDYLGEEQREKFERIWKTKKHF